MNARAWWCLVLLPLGGCFAFDEHIAACERGEGLCARDAGPGAQDGGTCEALAGNLLGNGSFERVSSDGGVPGWSADAPLTIHDGGAAHCQLWASYDAPDNSSMLQTEFDLPAVAEAGTLLEIGLSARSLDGETRGIVVQLRNRQGGYSPARTAQLAATGEWTPLTVTLPLAERGAQLQLELIPDRVRSVAFDRIFVRPAP